MNGGRCDAWHVEHDCRELGACQRALAAMCARIDARAAQERLERERDGAVDVVWPDDPRWVSPAPEVRRAA